MVFSSILCNSIGQFDVVHSGHGTLLHQEGVVLVQDLTLAFDNVNHTSCCWQWQAGSTVRLEVQISLCYLNDRTSSPDHASSLDHAHSPDPQDKYGVTPLHLACSRGNLPAVEVLLASHDIHVNAQDNNLDTPLHEACIAGDELIVEKLLQKMRSDDISLLMQNDEKQTPLHHACSEGHPEIVNLILKYGFQERPVLVAAQDNEHNTPLHLACESGKDEIVKTLLLNGADMGAVKDDEVTAIHIAARRGYRNVVMILLEAGRDIMYDVDVNQQTALHRAAEYNQCEMIDYLLDK